MGKVIFWLVVVFAVLFALRLYNSAKAKARQDARRAREAKATRELSAPTVRCIDCGVFLPKSDAVLSHTGYRCPEHARRPKH